MFKIETIILKLIVLKKYCIEEVTYQDRRGLKDHISRTYFINIVIKPM